MRTLLSGLLLLIAACSTNADAVSLAAAVDGTAPPVDAVLADASWPDIAAWIDRAAQDGPVVVNLFASWCGPCRAELPLLDAAAKEHPEVTFLGIDHQDLRAAGEGLLDEIPLSFASVFEPSGDAAGALGARGMPTTVFFGAGGTFIGRHTGELTPKKLDDWLQRL